MSRCIIGNMTTPERPRFSAAEAARRCGVSRTTIQRALKAGRIPGAVQGVNGWELPVEGLLQAGFRIDAPAPPDQHHDHAQAVIEQVRATDHLAGRVAELEAALAESRGEAERERAARIAAERVAEERDRIIERQDQALRMLTAGTGQGAPPSSTSQPPQLARPRGLLGRIADGLGL